MKMFMVHICAYNDDILICRTVCKSQTALSKELEAQKSLLDKSSERISHLISVGLQPSLDLYRLTFCRFAQGQRIAYQTLRYTVGLSPIADSNVHEPASDTSLHPRTTISNHSITIPARASD